jgi:inorganic triphosphatase YgiF
MASPATETELKFRLGPGAVVRLSGHPALQGPQTSQSLRSVYFDTPDGVLRAAGCGLRVRATPDGFVQTLKRQTGPGQTARDEWEVPVASEALDLAALKTTPAHKLLKGRRRDLSLRFASTVVRRIRMVAWEVDRIEVAFDAG